MALAHRSSSETEGSVRNHLGILLVCVGIVYNDDPGVAMPCRRHALDANVCLCVKRQATATDRQFSVRKKAKVHQLERPLAHYPTTPLPQTNGSPPASVVTERCGAEQVEGAGERAAAECRVRGREDESFDPGFSSATGRVGEGGADGGEAGDAAGGDVDGDGDGYDPSTRGD